MLFFTLNYATVASMSEQKARYITTTLPYVNADPHIGFAAEIVHADALARYFRAQGHEVFFNTGADEHGQKIAQKAEESSEAPQAYVDRFSETFSKLKESLSLSYDNFIRTTGDDHKKAAQELWRRCEANGDIYKKKYKGLYCVGDEMFLKESDLLDGKCPNHPNMDPVEIEEENYFFKLSNYQEYLEEYLSQESVIMPQWRREEALAFVKAGLEDFSISREKERLSWGVPVPGDENQVMYVWFDALSNYISTLAWPEDAGGDFKRFWEDGHTLQLAGKDQIRFQSIIWQAMLKSAGLPATDTVVYHGFITINGHKMSKSLGNVIAPADLVARYGTEATRYLLLRHVHPFEDTDITWERLDEWYTANLVNGLGNLAARIMKMAEDNLDAPVTPESFSYQGCVEESFETYNLQKAADYMWEYIGNLDARIQETQPFKVVKEDKEKGKELITQLVHDLHEVTSALVPLMPATSNTIQQAIAENKKPDTLFPRLEK